MFILYAVKHPIGIAGLGITTQVAVSRLQTIAIWLFTRLIVFEQTMAPLLIIARHGLVSRRDDRQMLASQIPLRIGVTHTEHTRVDTPVESSTGTRKNGLLSDSLPELSSDYHPKPFCDA